MPAKIAINARRLWLGAFSGWAVWIVWSSFVAVVILGPRYRAAQESGLLLQIPRFPFFIGFWAVVLLLLSLIIAWLYTSLRVTIGRGPRTAILVGVMVGFACGFPSNFATSTWLPIDRAFPLWWTLELWVGAVLASLVSGWIYRDRIAK